MFKTQNGGLIVLLILSNIIFIGLNCAKLWYKLKGFNEITIKRKTALCWPTFFKEVYLWNLKWLLNVKLPNLSGRTIDVNPANGMATQPR